MLRLALIAAAALVLAAPAHAEPFHTGNGISGDLPSGWRVLQRHFADCLDPREALAVSSFPIGRKPSLAGDGVFFVLEERDSFVNRLAARPRRFALRGAPQWMECCVPLHARGWSTQFRAAGRGFYLYAFLGHSATAETRARMLDVLDSLKFERFPTVRWRRSQPIGPPSSGRLRNGVQFPSFGEHFFTWDPLLHRSPDRSWRLWGSDRLVRTVLRVADDFDTLHFSRVGIGDFSRPRGGPFGPKHVSHQNGLDVDIYYPRLDRIERPPDRPSQVNRPLAQELLDQFVRAGAVRIFVGPNTGLTGPRGLVGVLPNHDNHMHVRFGARDRGFLLGRSGFGRPIRAFERGDPFARRRVLVVGCIHGTECDGIAVAHRLLSTQPRGLDLWIVPNLNPDGYASGVRYNGRGVDLNRNFQAGWKAMQRPGAAEYSGPKPWSEPETRIARDLISRIRPDVTIWYHQPLSLVRAWGRSVPVARRYAQLTGLPFRAMPWLAGTAPNWQNTRFRRGTSFVVELPRGPLSRSAAARHASAALRIAK